MPLGELGHVGNIAGRDDGDRISGVRDIEFEPCLVFHRAGVEAGDLVVVDVGGDVGPGREFLINDADVAVGHAVFFQPLEVPVIVLPDGGNDPRFLAQQRQRVGDIPGGAAEILGQAVDREAHVDHVDPFRQDVFGKPAGEVHDPVVGQGTRNQNLHVSRSSLLTPGCRRRVGVNKYQMSAAVLAGNGAAELDGVSDLHAGRRAGVYFQHILDFGTRPIAFQVRVLCPWGRRRNVP